MPESVPGRGSGRVRRLTRRTRTVCRNAITSWMRTWNRGRPRSGDAVIEWSVAEWADRTGGGSVVAATPGWTIPKIPPNTLEPEIHPRFSRSAVITVAPRTVVRVPGARLEVPPGCAWPPLEDGTDVLDRPRIVLPDDAVARESTQGLVNPVRPFPRRPGVRRHGPSCSLLTPWSLTGNYFHWIRDVLSNLHAVLPVLPEETRFVVPPDLRPFQVDSLAAIGIEADRLDEYAVPPAWARRRPWRFDDLWFANLGRIDPGDLAAFAAAVRAAVAAPPGPGPRRIYLSRVDARYRRVTNEDEITRHLRDEGFEIVVAGNLSFAEQVALVRDAEEIVAPHGAAFTNMIFAPAGVTIVDLQTSQVDQDFHELAQVLGHQYWYMTAHDRPSGTPYHDLDVPLERLTATLATARRATGR